MTELLLMIGPGLSGVAGRVRFDEDPHSVSIAGFAAGARVSAGAGAGNADSLPVDSVGGDRTGSPSAVIGDGAEGLLLGVLGRKTVAVVRNAPRRGDGSTLARVTCPVGVARELGAEILIVVDGARNLDDGRSVGDIVVLRDHINLLGDNPLVGANADDLGPRFPDMTEAYDRRLRELAVEVAGTLSLPIGEGVLAALTGPNLETPAERGMLRVIGADLAGNGTVPEVIVAGHRGMRVLAFSIVTAAPAREGAPPVPVVEAGRAVETAGQRLAELLEAVAHRL